MRLDECLQKVDKVFGIESILGQRLDDAATTEYYRQSEIGYRKVHSAEGGMHMALNDNGTFDASGYYAQARIIAGHIAALGAAAVLEVGCGKGFNSIYLAAGHQHVRFTGIDLTPENITLARRKAGSLANLRLATGNYQRLTAFPDGGFDIVFAVETLCYARDIKQAFGEIYRVLRPGGRLVIFDGFRTGRLADAGREAEIAARLVEKTMAVEEFATVESWLAAARATGFEVAEQQDLTPAVIPTVLRINRFARKYFRHTLLAVAARTVLPRYLVMNAVAGLIMPHTFGAGFHRYCSLALDKPL